MPINRHKYGQFGGKLRITFIEYSYKYSTNRILRFLQRCWPWLKKRQYLYEPDESDPFYFIDSYGKKITPERMLTDLGSVPRLFWSIISPWDFLQAYIIHDYEFVAHKKNKTNHSLTEVNTRFCEGIRTIQYNMGGKSNEVAIFILYLILQTFGKIVWNRKLKEDKDALE